MTATPHEASPAVLDQGLDVTIGEVRRLVIRDGDALAVFLDTDPQEWEVEEIKGRVRAVLARPDLPVMVLGPHATHLAVVEDSRGG